MVDDSDGERKRLTFAQAEGAEPLPSQLALGEVSQEMRAKVWEVIYNSIRESIHSVGFGGQVISGYWYPILRDHHVNRMHKLVDEFNDGAVEQIAIVKNIIARGNYISIFDFLQFVIRHNRCPPNLVFRIDSALSSARAAYRIVGEATIIPITSEAEGAAVQRAFADLTSAEFNGAKRHLSEAASQLTRGEYAASVRESMQAVESVARMLAGVGTLSAALKALETTKRIHPAVRLGFEKLYCYTSDEEGIRHPLLEDDQAAVDESDAVFMIGACASFVSYLIGKARSAGLLDNSR